MSEQTSESQPLETFTQTVQTTKKHITGVWSTESWDPLDPNKKELLTWLATIPTATQNTATLSDIESALTPFNITGSELITIVGKGSLGKNAPLAEHVKVATVPILTNNVHTGGYAYWTADESVKASYSIPVDPAPNTWNKAAYTTTPYRTGVEVIDPATLSDYPDIAKSQAINTPSLKTTDLNHKSSSVEPSKKYFHHLTNRSISLFTNTRHGGFKSDLSTAFELDRSEFDSIDEFHDSSERNDTSNYSRLSLTI